jgi:hypothetical protein
MPARRGSADGAIAVPWLRSRLVCTDIAAVPHPPVVARSLPEDLSRSCCPCAALVPLPWFLLGRFLPAPLSLGPHLSHLRRLSVSRAHCSLASRPFPLRRLFSWTVYWPAPSPRGVSAGAVSRSGAFPARRCLLAVRRSTVCVFQAQILRLVMTASLGASTPTSSCSTDVER